MLKLKGELRGTKEMKDEVSLLTPLYKGIELIEPLLQGTSFQISWFKIPIISILKSQTELGSRAYITYKSPDLS